MSPRILAALAVAALATGCVWKDDYVAKEMEASKYRKAYEDETERNADFAKKLGELKVRVESLEAEGKALSEKVKAQEENLAAKQADLRTAQERADALQALVDELSKSKRQLEQAKAELEKRSSEYERLAASLRDEIQEGKIELSELRGKMTVKMKDKVLFASGSATLGKEGKDALRKVAEAFRGLQRRVVRVEGHTDDVPTGEGSPFPSNWELSSARAIAVVRFLQENGVDPTLLAAAGYSQYQPLSPNDSPQGRSFNRRIEIVLAAAPGTGAPVPAVLPEPPKPEPVPASIKAKKKKP